MDKNLITLLEIIERNSLTVDASTAKLIELMNILKRNGIEV